MLRERATFAYGSSVDLHMLAVVLADRRAASRSAFWV
jgi:hypothetical protein